MLSASMFNSSAGIFLCIDIFFPQLAVLPIMFLVSFVIGCSESLFREHLLLMILLMLQQRHRYSRIKLKLSARWKKSLSHGCLASRYPCGNFSYLTCV